MNISQSVDHLLVSVTPETILTYEHVGYTAPSSQSLALQQTQSLSTAGVRITIRSEAGVLHQVLIEIDSNRNGSFDDINDAFFSIDPRQQAIAAGMGDEGGIIQSAEVVAGVLAFIAQLNLTHPKLFEQDMRTLSNYVMRSTEMVLKMVVATR